MLVFLLQNSCANNLRRIVRWSQHSKTFYHSHLKGILPKVFCLGYWSPYVLGRCCIGRLFTWVGKKCLVYGWAMDHLCRLHQTWWAVKSKSVLQLLQNKLLAINYWLLALCQGICWSSESDTLKFHLKPCLHPSHPLPTSSLFSPFSNTF